MEGTEFCFCVKGSAKFESTMNKDVSSNSQGRVEATKSSSNSKQKQDA